MDDWDNFIGAKFEFSEAEKEALYRLWFEPIEMRMSDPECERRPRRGFIYLFFDGSSLYKIGLAKNVSRRLKQVRRQYHNELITPIHSFPTDDMDRAEQGLHTHYSDYRSCDEWFALETDQVNQILKILQYENGEFILARRRKERQGNDL